MRILIIEDNIELVDLMKKALKVSTFEVDSALNLEDGSYKTGVNGYDAIILDLNLPDGHGLDLVRDLREAGNSVPIIILTAHGNVKDKVEGLNSGADDYLSKPFSMDELVARVKSLTRRNTSEKRPRISCGELELDQLSYEVSFKEEKMQLAKKEFMLLEYLMLNKGKVITRPQIWEHVWGLDDYPLNNTVDVHVANLRRKMKKISGEDMILTIRGIGYKIECAGC